MVSYAADSHQLYGALYKYDAPRKGYRPGTMMPVYEWDTGRYLGDIPQAAHQRVCAERSDRGREKSG